MKKGISCIIQYKRIKMAENLENKFVWNRKPDGRYFKNVIPNNILCQNLWILEIIWYILKFRNIWILRFSKTKTDFFFNFKCLVNEEWNGYTASDLLTNFMGEFTFCNAEEYSVKTQKQPPKVFYIKRCSREFRKIHKKIHVSDSLFNKNASGLQF